MIFNPAVSEDIEIYTDSLSSGSNGTIKPNILFIADTSGSMKNLVASNSMIGGYDPTVDYGNDDAAADDDLIYVYDTNLDWTGKTITTAQNVCQSMTDFYTATPDFPMYSDRAIQWQSKTITLEEVCTGGDDASSSFTRLSSATAVNGHRVPGIGVPESQLIDGTQVEFKVTAGSRDIRISIDYEDSSGITQNTSCHDKHIRQGKTSSCEVDLPVDAKQIWGYVRGYDATREDSYNAELTINIGAVTEIICTGGGSVEVTQWTKDIATSSDSSWVLECARDQGAHGYTSTSSADTYPEFCPGGTTCLTPKYTSSSSGAIDYEDENVGYHFFVPGNYHDYLSAGLQITPNLVGGRDADTYCGNRNKRDHLFIDNDTGLVFQCQQKLEILHQALEDMVTSLTGMNMGLMRLYGDNGGIIVDAISDLDVASNLAGIKTSISELPARGSTPLSEALYEAYLYYAGKTPVWANAGGIISNTKDSTAFASNGNYDSPIEHSCQSNNIIYLTDGTPNKDDGSISDIESLLGGVNCYDAPGVVPGPWTDDISENSCLDDLAGYMADQDIHVGSTGTDTVNTYTIGFDIDLELMEETASKGKGSYHVAYDYRELIQAFQEIIVTIAQTAQSTLVAPAVSVNAFNELQHRDQIYFAVFDPRATPRWLGNVKKFSIDAGGIVRDRNGNDAIDSDSGFFSDIATSFWSDVVDGPNVDMGGFIEQLTKSRAIYIDGSTLDSPSSDIVKLGAADVLSISATGALNVDEAISIRDWLLGIDVLDQDKDNLIVDAHRYASDPLHSKPFVITYSGSSTANARDVLFVTTNSGMLHAIDARDDYGTELWSYIPAELMGNPLVYMNDSDNKHKYGLDGEATVWTKEAQSSTSSNFSLEKVYMYQGMRRGGNLYYGWDLSNAISTTATPISELFKIVGGSTGFEKLGQTWSKMVRTQLSYGCNNATTNDGCTTKDVLVFSGGYDSYYDDETNALLQAKRNGLKGNSVYIVDATDGSLIWSAGCCTGSDETGQYDLELPMYNSIPADPTPLDMDGDGDMDMLFVIDIAGNVFRMDFDQTNSATDSNYATGGKIADLSSTSHKRRFYNAIDASLVVPDQDDSYIALAFGSGYRAHPKEKETWANHFYVLIDNNITGPAIDDNDTPNNESDDTAIYKYVVDTAGSRSVIGISALHSGGNYTKGADGDFGFYISLSQNDHEKILQSSFTFNGDIIVASYIPPLGNQTTTCGSGDIGDGRVYKLSVKTGNSTLDIDNDGTVENYYTLLRGGIPPKGVPLILPDAPTPIVCFGTQCTANLTDYEIGTATKTYWREE